MLFKQTLVKFVPAALVMTALMPVAVSAASTINTNASCTVKAAPVAERFTVKDGTVTGKVIVTGNDDCKATVTIAAWQTTSVKDPAHDTTYQSDFYKNQKLFSHDTETFGPGIHEISTKLPSCFYQVDMVKGGSATGVWPGGAAGGPVYPVAKMLGSTHGGTQACETPGQGGGTVTPPASTPQPTALPETGGVGASVIAFMLSLAGVAYTALRRKQLA